MENPRYHPLFQAAIDKGKAHPERLARIETIERYVESLPPDWSSKLCQVYNRCLAEGLIDPYVDPED